MSLLSGLTYDELAAAYLQLQTEYEQYKHNNAALVRATIHELRTPLTAILGFFSLLDTSMTAEQMQAYIPPVLEEGERLARTITDLHFQNELDSGRMAFKPAATSLETILNQTIRDCQYRSPDRDIVKRARRTLPVVMIDPEKAGAVLDILVRTTTRFSPAETPVYLSAESQGASVNVIIRSDHLDIPNEYREAVFEKCLELPISGGRIRLVVGLGLYAAREMARRMSGDVEFLEIRSGVRAFKFQMPIAA